MPSLGRQVGNTLSVFGAFTWTDTAARDKWMKIIMVVLPITWGLLAVAVQSPLQLVIIAGILNALFLMGVALSTLYLSRSETDPRVKDGVVFHGLLWISAVAIFAVGIISLLDQF